MDSRKGFLWPVAMAGLSKLKRLEIQKTKMTTSNNSTKSFALNVLTLACVAGRG